MRQPPINMGDAFVVDDGELGITIKKKDGKSFQEILDMWPQEKEKQWSYKNFNHYCFFNDMGADEITKWLWDRKTGLVLDKI